MKVRVLIVVGLALGIVASATTYAITRSTTDNEDPSLTQDEIRAELLQLGEKSLSATFRVELQGPGETITWFQQGQRLRLDLRDTGPDGQRERTYVENGNDEYFSCREPGLCAEGTTELFDYGSEQADLEGIGSVLLFGVHAFGTGLVQTHVTRHSEEIANVTGICFTMPQSEDYEEQICFDKSGVPLRLTFRYVAEGNLIPATGYEAIRVDHSVSDSDFEPPYPPEGS